MLPCAPWSTTPSSGEGPGRAASPRHSCFPAAPSPPAGAIGARRECGEPRAAGGADVACAALPTRPHANRRPALPRCSSPCTAILSQEEGKFPGVPRPPLSQAWCQQGKAVPQDKSCAGALALVRNGGTLSSPGAASSMLSSSPTWLYWCFIPGGHGIPLHRVWHSCHLLPQQRAEMEMLPWLPSPIWYVLPGCGPLHPLPAEAWPAYLTPELSKEIPIPAEIFGHPEEKSQ